MAAASAPSKGAQILVGLVFALMAGLASGLVFANRDFVFEWSWQPPKGRFEETVPPALSLAARDYAESKHPGQACVVKPVGRDDRYVFAAIGCGKFGANPGAPQEGDATMVASRLRYRGDRVNSWEMPERGAYENAVRRLFPAVAFERMRYGVPHADYWAAGAARMKEKNMGALR